MSFKRFLCTAGCLCLILSGTLAAQEELLKASDINRVMQQIFVQHVAKKNMSNEILKNAFGIYIDQFDPYRTYLLEEEAAPFTQMSDSDLAQVMAQYRKQDFTVFAQLNKVIQKAIERQRTYRKDIEQDRSALFQVSASKDADHIAYEDPDLKVAFAKTEDQLKERLKQRLIHFVYEEKRHFGEEAVMKNQDRTIEIYENHLNNHEDSYLFAAENGTSLSPAQQENLFVIHVLKALTASLDAHTTFYNNSEAYDLKVLLEKGFDGIGVVLQQSADGGLVITHLVKGGPAANSGLILEKDRIVSIDGKSITDQSFEKVMKLLRGERDSVVKLVLMRKDGDNSKELEVALKRAPIAVDEDRVDVSSEPFANGIIGTITLHAFYQGANGINSENDVHNAIKELQKKGPLKGLILDLRDNSGGFLSQAVKVAGIFIKSGVIVISKYSDGKEQIYRDMGGKAFYTGPLIVLTSKATASAAEIVAQALQDYGVGIVVGDERTYGKGTIQSQTVTDDKATSYFKVTVGKYYTVSGKTPQIRGVVADIVVPGPYAFDHIGEQFLEYSLPNDTIKPEYKDDLSDVDPGLRAWYLRYYLPSLQPKINTWRHLLPSLKPLSEERLASNKPYQDMINEWKLESNGGGSDDQSKKTQDYQLLEAQSILKDMVVLHARERAPIATSASQPFSGPNDK